MPSIDLSPIAVPPPTTVLELRTSKLKQFGTVLSGIDKQAIDVPLYVSTTGLTDDEHDLTFHGGVDKAIHQYDHSHYAFWRSRHPQAAAKFVAGGFGENFVAEGFTEENICISDVVRVGPEHSTLTGGDNGCMLQVSLARQPCFKLNQRFGVKNFAPQTHQENKTGWYYRVLEQGYISAGMELRVIKRRQPLWSIARLQHFVHRDKSDLDIAKELSEMPELGAECRKMFKQRILEADTEAREIVNQWTDYIVTSKIPETPRIVRLELTAINIPEAGSKAIPAGSYALLKLPNGLKRAYSIVIGNSSSFTLGIALDDKSRGGSSYIHNHLSIGTTLQVGQINRSIKPNGMASHHIFIVGGIGITAFISTMKKLQSINQTFELHYAVRCAEDVAFQTLMSNFRDSVRVYDKQAGQIMDISQILKDRVGNSHVFTCGPERMISSVIAAAKEVGMAEDGVFYETFITDTTGDPFTVDVVAAKKTTRLSVGSGQSLLGVMRAAGLEVASSCETGSCGTCRIGLKEGKVVHKGKGLTTQEQENEMLCCVSRGEGHIVVELEV
jgi:MOSC domain-containing protein YiiM/ferredoxin-NADP reductase